VRSIYTAIAFGVAFLVVSFGSNAATAPWQPTRPVAFIIGAAPGGSIDLSARMIQQLWDQNRITSTPTIIINKPGAAHGLAWSYLNDRGADGHSISIGTTNLVTNEIIGSHKLGYRDVTPLAVLFDDYIALAVRADSPLKNWKDVAERLRRDAGALTIAFGPSLGAGPHTAAAVAIKAAGVNAAGARFVVYKSAGEALVALLGGQIDIVAGSLPNMPAYMQSGRIRVLGITAPRRVEGAFAQVPTLKEQGFDAVFTNWRSVIGPKNMRPEHIAYWERALAQVSQTADWKRDLERNYWTSNFLTGADAFRFIDNSSKQFRALWAEIGTKAGQ
jgi:putative tricarboxylic transport membrane protein